MTNVLRWVSTWMGEGLDDLHRSNSQGNLAEVDETQGPSVNRAPVGRPVHTMHLLLTPMRPAAASI